MTIYVFVAVTINKNLKKYHLFNWIVNCSLEKLIFYILWVCEIFIYRYVPYSLLFTNVKKWKVLLKIEITQDESRKPDKYNPNQNCRRLANFRRYLDFSLIYATKNPGYSQCKTSALS